MRNLAAEEEEKLTETLNSFNGAVQDLKVVTSQIDRYNDSNSESELNKISQRESELVEKEKTKLSQIEALQPGLDRLVKAVDDQGMYGH